MKLISNIQHALTSNFTQPAIENPICQLQVEGLEERCMLSAEAGIFYNAELAQVVIRGTNLADVGSMDFIDDGTARASLSGFESQDFALESIDNIIFQGFAGDDTFTNNTFYESYQIGGSGNDNLTGGSNDDRLSGGGGNDFLFGEGGEDTLIGLGGNDEMFGGDGNDRMLGGAGLNFMEGNEGNDVMYGGANRDEMYGGDGIDKMYALGGDDFISTGNGGVAGSEGTAQADLAKGQGGNDEFEGGDGLNIFYGGNGDDFMIGGYDAENRMHGQNGDDEIIGGESTDLIFGHRGEDTILSFGGNDFIKGGYDNDTINAGDGTDFIIYGDDYLDYRITGDNSDLTVTHQRPVDGVDNIVNAEFLRYADKEVVADDPIVEIITVQPIIVSNDDGTNTAGMFGTAAESQLIMDQINDIYYAAGVEVDWLAPTQWNDTYANIGDDGNRDPRPGSDLSNILSAGDEVGVGNSDPLVLDMYFVEISPAFSQTSDFTANGYARVGGNGSTVHIGDGLTTFDSGRDVASRVTAHEIGHNLGLDHNTILGNLMSTNSSGPDLTEEQIAEIIASEFTVPLDPPVVD